jgi:hypothetical protein
MGGYSGVFWVIYVKYVCTLARYQTQLDFVGWVTALSQVLRPLFTA